MTGRGGVRQMRRPGIHGSGHLGETRDRRVLARWSDGLDGRTAVDVGEAHLLHRVQVVEVAPVLLEAVRRRQRRGVVAQVVLAEFAGGVAEIVQELGERRGSRPQVRRAARQLRWDHAGAQRIHAREEGIAPGGAALHGHIVHEDRAFAPDAVDVGRFTDHQTPVIDARLHPADVVTHDEQDIRLLRVGCPCVARSQASRQYQGSARRPRRCAYPELSIGTHLRLLLSTACQPGKTARCTRQRRPVKSRVTADRPGLYHALRHGPAAFLPIGPLGFLRY